MDVKSDIKMIVNGVLKGRILPLPPRYNFFTNYRYYRYGDLLRHAPWYEAVTAEAFRTAKRHPAILHFCGDERPWIRGNLSHYRHIYRRYAALTPWKDEKDLPGMLQELRDILPYSFECHGKFHYLDEDCHEASIPYNEILPVLVEEGYDGYLICEYEDELYCGGTEFTKRQMIMEKRLLGLG